MSTISRREARRERDSAGQSLVEFALVLPLLLVCAFGVVDVGSELLDAHIVNRLSREGSNMISRDTTLQDTVTAMKLMTAKPVNFDDGTSKVILSVFERVATTSAANYDKVVLYQRVEYGTLPNHSALTTLGAGSFGGAPDYLAINPANDPSLVVMNFPVNLLPTKGDLIYVTEIYSTHTFITPLQVLLKTAFPTTLYSIAYF